MYTKTVFVPCTIGAICLHFFQVSKGKQKVSNERDTHMIGPLGMSLSLSLSVPTLSLPLLT